MLVGDGYDDEKLGRMKMVRIYKLQFMRYKENYLNWYRFEKNKNKQ